MSPLVVHSLPSSGRSLGGPVRHWTPKFESIVARLLCSSVTRTPFVTAASPSAGVVVFLAKPRTIDPVHRNLMLDYEVANNCVGHRLRGLHPGAALALHFDDVTLLAGELSWLTSSRSDFACRPKRRASRSKRNRRRGYRLVLIQIAYRVAAHRSGCSRCLPAVLRCIRTVGRVLCMLISRVGRIHRLLDAGLSPEHLRPNIVSILGLQLIQFVRTDP